MPLARIAMPALHRRAFLSGAASAFAGCAGSGVPVGRSESPRRLRLVAQPVDAPLRGLARPPVAAWGYGSVPGPEIRVRQGERLQVEVLNRLPQATTVHWHGVRLPNAMDGVPHLTQPPIAPGGRFVYEFEVPDAGTYWYHPHHQSSEQVGRGLYGALIVEEADPPAFDRDLVWVLDDWRLTGDGRISGTFDHPRDISHDGRIGNHVTVNGVDRSAFALRAGERLRLRLVNAANARLFALEFDGHRPLVIALDGQPVAPHEPPDGRVVLGPGMRADLVLDAVGRPGQRFPVRDTFYRRRPYDLLHLAYEPAPLRESPPDTPVRLTANPLAEPDLSRAETHTIRFEGGMMGRLVRATVDGEPMGMRELLRRGKAWAVNGVVADRHVMPPLLTLERGRTCVLALRNDTRWHHPIHLHGHSFRVLRRRGEDTPRRAWRDTVLMAPDETLDIAFVADNPGSWMFHCYVLEHQAGGMMGVIRVT